MRADHCQRLTNRILKGLLPSGPGRVDPFKRRRARKAARALAILISKKGAAWQLADLRMPAELLEDLGDRGLAVRWTDNAGRAWVTLTQEAADLAKRVPSSDGGLLDPEVSRTVAIARGIPAITPYRKPEGAISYAKELADGIGLFSQARWAS